MIGLCDIALLTYTPPLGLSRENSTASRPSSAMSGGGRGQVRLRSAPTRRPRPLSIATTGMTSSTNGMTTSMFEDRQRPQLRNKACTCVCIYHFTLTRLDLHEVHFPTTSSGVHSF